MIFTSLFLIFIACQTYQPTPISQAEQRPEKISPEVPKEMWQEEWERTIALGRKEGKVAIYSSAGNELRLAFMEAFPKKTGIALEMTIGKSAALAEKVLTESGNGLYLLDLFMSGLTSLVTTLKWAKALDPIEPTLILPEVLDKSL